MFKDIYFAPTHIEAKIFESYAPEKIPLDVVYSVTKHELKVLYKYQIEGGVLDNTFFPNLLNASFKHDSRMDYFLEFDMKITKWYIQTMKEPGYPVCVFALPYKDTLDKEYGWFSDRIYYSYTHPDLIPPTPESYVWLDTTNMKFKKELHNINNMFNDDTLENTVLGGRIYTSFPSGRFDTYYGGVTLWIEKLAIYTSTQL